jgi:hypothetical protein
MKTLQEMVIGTLFVAEAISAFSESNAGEKTSEMRVSLTIENACSIATSFAHANVSGFVAVNCTALKTPDTVPYAVTLETESQKSHGTDMPSVVILTISF